MAALPHAIAVTTRAGQIEIADLTDAQLAQVVTEQLTLVEEAYWNLVFAVRNLEPRRRDTAEDL